MNDDVRTATGDRQEGEAVASARHRIALLAETVGRRHPDYATGLNQLALLLIMQGEPDAAEPLLREALGVRRDTLGETHPDYATNLSSLGGLLWARGELDQAEPLLRKAAEIRVATLGPGHPKTVVSMNSLDQLIQARRAWGVPAAADAPEPSPVTITVPVRLPDAPQPAAPVLRFTAAAARETTPPAPPVVATRRGPWETPDDLTTGHAALAAAFASLGDRLAAAGLAFRDRGELPSPELMETLAAARGDFGAWSARLVEVAGGLGVATPEPGAAGLAGLAAVLPAVEEAEDARRRFETLRGQALRLLGDVEALTCASDPGFAPLMACRGAAAETRARVNRAEARTSGEECRALASGSHPLASLLALVGADDRTDDATWADHFDAVESAFGPALAAAAARGRIARKTF